MSDITWLPSWTGTRLHAVTPERGHFALCQVPTVPSERPAAFLPARVLHMRAHPGHYARCKVCERSAKAREER